MPTNEDDCASTECVTSQKQVIHHEQGKFQLESKEFHSELVDGEHSDGDQEQETVKSNACTQDPENKIACGVAPAGIRHWPKKHRPQKPVHTTR